MAKLAVSIGVFVLLVAGCSGADDEVTTTVSPSSTTLVTGGETPLEIVTAWLDSLAIGRYSVSDVAVVERQFILILAVESYSVELYDALARDGISSQVSETFWESFVVSVRGFTGADITEVATLGERRFDAYGGRFAEVEAASPRGDLTVVAVLAEDGRWYVDLLATFGPSFAPLFNLWMDRLPGEASGPVEALRGEQASLEVARDRARETGDADTSAELERLLERLNLG